MRYDFEVGRGDESVHPFTINFSNKDVRITTHYYENEFISALDSTIHEPGHAIYEQDSPDLYKNIEKGSFEELHQLLNENIHKYGAIYKPEELIKKVTGEALSAKYFAQYLNEKYKGIYNL